MVIETIVSLLTSGATGGLVGILGSWLKGRDERKREKQQFEHEANMRQVDIQELRMEAELKHKQIKLENDGRVQLANIELTRALDVEDAKAYQLSYANDKATYGDKWIDRIRGAMRPLLTVYTVTILSYIAFKMYQLAGGLEGMDAAFIEDQLRNIISTMLFLATSTTLWWFGTRPTHRSIGENK